MCVGLSVDQPCVLLPGAAAAVPWRTVPLNRQRSPQLQPGVGGRGGAGLGLRRNDSNSVDHNLFRDTVSLALNTSQNTVAKQEHIVID